MIAETPNNNKIPLVLKLLLPLVIGVVFAFYTDLVIASTVIYSFLGVLLILGLPVISKQFQFRFFFGGIGMVFFFLLGIYLVRIQTNELHDQYFFNADRSKESVYQVKILDEPIEKKNSIKCFANVLAVDGQPTIGKVLLYLEKITESFSIQYGDIICLSSNFQPIVPNGNPKEFDYSRYLKIHGVRHQVYVRSDKWQKVGHDSNPFYTGILKIRQFLDDRLSKSGLAPAELMVAKALILGEKESLDRDTLRTYSSAGAMHVLAVSGLHVGIVMLLVSFLLKPIKLLPKGQFLFMVGVLVTIWFYALVTGMSSSVLRASVMFSFVLIGKEIERENSVYQSILVSAFLLILVEPLVIFQVGFQLSYLAVFGIVYLQPKIYNLLYIKNYLGDKIWQISSVSIAAQFATFPLGLYYFHQFPNFFMLSNLIVIPLAFAILLVGLLYLILAWVPFLNEVIFFVLDLLISFLNKGVKWVESLPYSIYWGVSIEWFEVCWLYLILISGSASFVLRKTNLFVATLVSVLILLGYNIGENYMLSGTKQLVIYNVNKDVAIDVFNGRSNYFLATEQLIEDDEKMLFHIKHNWFYRTGVEEASSFSALPAGNSLLQFEDHTLWICSNPVVDSLPITQFIYLYAIEYFPQNFIDRVNESNAFVIFGDGIGFKARKFFKGQFDPKRIHELTTSGAFVYEY